MRWSLCSLAVYWKPSEEQLVKLNIDDSFDMNLLIDGDWGWTCSRCLKSVASPFVWLSRRLNFHTIFGLRWMLLQLLPYLSTVQMDRHTFDIPITWIHVLLRDLHVRISLERAITLLILWWNFSDMYILLLVMIIRQRQRCSLVWLVLRLD